MTTTETNPNPALRARVALNAIRDTTRSEFVLDAVAQIHAAIDKLAPYRRQVGYVPASGTTDDDTRVAAHLTCPTCGGTSFYEVDTAERWTDVEESDDGEGLFLCYDSGGDFESDHLKCANPHCYQQCDYPPNWPNLITES